MSEQGHSQNGYEEGKGLEEFTVHLVTQSLDGEPERKCCSKDNTTENGTAAAKMYTAQEGMIAAYKTPSTI